MRSMFSSVFLVFIFAVGHEGLHVHGPSGPVMVQLGGSVLLPCFIRSSLPLEHLQVEWRKMDSDSVVSFFQQGKSRAALQSEAFRGRADFFIDDVSKGNFSILLQHVVEEDAGGYRCKVNTAQDSGEVIMEVNHFRSLVVTGADRALVVSGGEDVVLNCSVDSHVPVSEIEEVTWKKMDGDQNILVLLYQNNEIFSDSSHVNYEGRVDFFTSEIPKGNFSLKLRDVQMEDEGEFMCEVHTRNMSGHTTVVMHRVGSLVVTGADRALFVSGGEDVVLNCSVDSHVPVSEIEEVTWKKMDGDQNILVLLYQDNEIFSDSSDVSYQGRVDFFTSEISKGNFSLKLRDVQMEDKGEFTCEVHTRNMSGRSTVVLHRVGFSALHIAMLVLCSVTLIITVGFCAYVLYLLRKKVVSKVSMKSHLFLIFFPNICIFLTFCLWSKEGFYSEVVVCSAVSIMRPVMLIKTSPYLNILPQRLRKVVKALTVPLYYSTVAIAASSSYFTNIVRVQETRDHILTTLLVLVLVIISNLLAVYGFQIYTIYIQIFNIALLVILLSKPSTSFDHNFEIPSGTSPQVIGMMMVLVLQRHLFQGKPFGRMDIALPSFATTVISLSLMCIYIIDSLRVKDFSKEWILLFEGVIYILAWLGEIYILHRYRGQIRGCCRQWRKIGCLCCVASIAVLSVVFVAFSFYYLHYYMKEKDHAGYFPLIGLVHVLTAVSLFKHPKYLPPLLHTVIYMFGAVGLSSVNAVVLATELILKAEKGTRTVEDLRVIVLSCETVYLLAWLALQIYDLWKKLNDGTSFNFEDESRTEAEIVPEMVGLSDLTPDPD